jgi:serine/threonine protein kinase
MPIEAGQNLLHYRLIEKIGEGGMGLVWKAVDTTLDREVAIKILPDTVAGRPDRLARFEREAKAVAALAHPNILAVYDFGREGETTYMVTELLVGSSLRERLTEGPLPPRSAAELARQVARGLAAAHEKGFVHRDLKPENVFVTSEGRAKILDFGLAASTAAGRGADPSSTHTPTETELTAPGSVMGTVDYMSPEQVRGETVDHRSDIFSFGTLLYEMLTATRPFRRDTGAETMTAVLREDPSPTGSESHPQISPALERVVLRCLEKQPGERFQSSSDLAFAVDNALGARAPTPRSSKRPPCPRSSRAAAGWRWSPPWRCWRSGWWPDG